MKNIILCPADKSEWECKRFWTDAGYKSGRDFTIKNGEIKAKTQMILARDAIEFGFKIK